MRYFIDSIYYVLTKKITFMEVALNLSFLLIVGIIIYIYYWDLINKQVFSSSKCKNNINIINNSESYNYVNAKDVNNNNLYAIKYDKNTKTPIVNCTCSFGNVVNNFKNIKVYDSSGTNGQKNKNIYKSCNCDKTYITDPLSQTNIYYSGDQFLVNYMQNNNSLDTTESYFIDKTDISNYYIPLFPS